MVLKSSFFVVLLALVLPSCGDSTNEQRMEDPATVVSGKELFVNHCAACHGMDGTLGLSGASDLSKSTLTQEAIMNILKDGRNGMPSLAPILKSDENMAAVTTYTLELRK